MSGEVVQLRPALRCPDCGEEWPGFLAWEPCPGCGQTRDAIEAAAALWEILTGESSA